MIDMRNTRRIQGKIAELIARYDFLYDLTNYPDFYLSSIQDFRDNETAIRDGRAFEFARVQYSPKEDNEFEIRDQTGSLATQLYVDGTESACKAESWFQRNVLSDPIRKKLLGLNGGDSMHKVSLQKNNGRIYVLDFDVAGPFGLDRSEKDYLAWRFPKLVPSLVTTDFLPRS